MASSLHPAFAYCLLKLVQLLLWLVHLAVPQLSSTLSKIIMYLEGRPKLEFDRSSHGPSDRIVQTFLQHSKGKYRDVVNLQRIGSRKGRHWYKVTGPDGTDKLLTLTPVSKYCPLRLEEEGVVSALNSLLHKIQVPVLHSVEEVYYSHQDHSIVMIQPFMETGSLRDVIHQTDPNLHWRQKYAQSLGTFEETKQKPARSSADQSSEQQQTMSLSQRLPVKSRAIGCGLPVDKVANYGRQILQALLYLYDLGFPYLGQIHSGNILVENDVCTLGGYESTLLGYRNHFHKLCSKENIDVIMFGHLLFEMGCGYELSTLEPTSDDLKSVADSSLLDVLCLIFHKDERGRFTATIEKVCVHTFFQCVRILPQNSRRRSRNSDLSTELSKLVSQLAPVQPSKCASQQQVRHRHKHCIIQ